jgi:hypothetical protein
VLGTWFSALPVQAKYSGGSGTPDDPYQIATPQDLNDIGNHEEDWDKYFILVNDVDLAGYTGSQFNIIGKGSPPRFQDPNTRGFSGVFDGKGDRIWNFTYSSTKISSVGLFRYVLLDGQIKNLGMENVNIEACGDIYYEGVGAVAGTNHGTISGCCSTGSVKAGRDAGGLVGYSLGGVIPTAIRQPTFRGVGSMAAGWWEQTAAR